MKSRYALGLDYGTNSVRALIVDVRNGREVGTAVWEYAHGDHGVILSRDPNLARQHPADYVKVCGADLFQHMGRRFFRTFADVTAGLPEDPEGEGDAIKALKETYLDAIIDRVR